MRPVPGRAQDRDIDYLVAVTVLIRPSRATGLSVWSRMSGGMLTSLKPVVMVEVCRRVVDACGRSVHA